MTKVYMVTESTWDHYENVRAYSSKDKAEEWCNSQYKKTTPEMWRGSIGYDYWIEEFDIDASD